MTSRPPPLQRLTKRTQFLFVRNGLRTSRGAVLVEARKREASGPIGIGFTASRKVGSAVVRNRSRRRLREAARRLLPELGVAGTDYVFVARPQTANAPWPRLLDDLRSALIRLRADLEAGVQGGRPPRASAQKQRNSTTGND